MNKLKIDEPISIFVSKNETLTHKAFLYAKTKSSKPKYYNLKNINTGYFTINTTTTTQTLCTELINFLNCNFDNYDDCFMWFTKFFTSYIIYTGEDDINKFEVNKLYSFNKVKELFKKYPPKRIYVSSSRLQCAKNGDFETYKKGTGTAVAYAWYLWEKGYNGDTIIRWVN